MKKSHIVEFICSVTLSSLLVFAVCDSYGFNMIVHILAILVTIAIFMLLAVKFKFISLRPLCKNNSKSSFTEENVLPSEHVVIDFETTGLSPYADKIIEVACLKCVNGLTYEYHSMVSPGISIPEEASRISGIKDSDVEGAPSIITVAKEIYEFCGNLPLVAHNAPFDIKFLKQAYLISGIRQSLVYVDTLHLARMAYPQFPTHKLSYLVTTLGISSEQTHRAMDDVICTKKLLDLCIAEIAERESSSWCDVFNSSISQ